MKSIAWLCAIFFFSYNANAIRFDQACEPGESITIGAVGDILLHGPLQRQSYSHDAGFVSLWSEILELMQGPHIMYANLEGPAAYGVRAGGYEAKDPGKRFDKRVYGSYPLFNYHPSLITDLKDSGVDIVSTANNHSMDRGSLGVRRTIEALEKENLAYTGTRDETADSFHVITENNGIRLAWISCTYSTNGVPDKQDLTLDCFEKQERVSRYIQELKDQVDGVIITPHWGYEYKLSPNKRQKQYAKKWLNEGALAIIGAHPHVPQPWEKHITPDGRETVIVYSLGNFVSNQPQRNRRTSLIFYLGITKNNGRTWINGVRYVPLYMNRYPHSIVATNELNKRNSEQRQTLKTLSRLFGDERAVLKNEPVVTNAECE